MANAKTETGKEKHLWLTGSEEPHMRLGSEFIHIHGIVLLHTVHVFLD